MVILVQSLAGSLKYLFLSLSVLSYLKCERVKLAGHFFWGAVILKKV